MWLQGAQMRSWARARVVGTCRLGASGRTPKRVVLQRCAHAAGRAAPSPGDRPCARHVSFRPRARRVVPRGVWRWGRLYWRKWRPAAAARQLAGALKPLANVCFELLFHAPKGGPADYRCSFHTPPKPRTARWCPLDRARLSYACLGKRHSVLLLARRAWRARPATQGGTRPTGQGMSARHCVRPGTLYPLPLRVGRHTRHTSGAAPWKPRAANAGS